MIRILERDSDTLPSGALAPKSASCDLLHREARRPRRLAPQGGEPAHSMLPVPRDPWLASERAGTGLKEAMKIESLDQDIRTLLSSAYYRIPRFQRPYSWTRENIQDFWDDVIRDNPPDYFIGSMVVFKDGNQRFGVVDGQQRLTTIMILLAVLRNALSNVGFKALAEGIQGLIERKNIDNVPEFILSTETSYPFFQDHILKMGAPDTPVIPMKEEDNLQAAYEQFSALISGVVDVDMKNPAVAEAKRRENAKRRLVSIRDAVLGLKVIFVKLDDEDDAYIIFETLNTRGKDLSLTDLVKNHLNKHLKPGSASVDQTKVKWERILETIEGSSAELATDAFIHHFWLSRYDYRPAKTLFKELRKKVTKAEAKGFLDSLVSDAQLYRGVHEVTFGKWTKQERGISDSLHALQVFHVSQQTPCVLSLVRAYKDQKKIKMSHLKDGLLAIEKFHFLGSAVTAQRSSGGVSAMYASLGRRLFEATNQAASLLIIKELKQKLRERIPSLEEVKALFPQIVFTDAITKQKRLVKYILSEFRKSQSPGISIDYDAMTIEHLVPQSEIGVGDFYETVVGQLGNLILVSEELNNQLANRTFVEKKKILQKKGLLPAHLVQASTWTAKDINNRTTAMAEHAYKSIWRI